MCINTYIMLYNICNVGDFIIEINGNNVFGQNHGNVANHIKNSPPLVELLIFRRNVQKGEQCI